METAASFETASYSINDVEAKENAELQAHVNQLRDALTHADEFIRNGIEFGYVRMPDESLKGIDSAHDTPEIIRKALAQNSTKSLIEHYNDVIERIALALENAEGEFKTLPEYVALVRGIKNE